MWELRGPDNQTQRVEIAPRLFCHDFVVLRAAVLAGSGITKLPDNVVRADLQAAKLERVLPQWNTPLGVAHLVFPTRRGLLPAVRVLHRLPGHPARGSYLTVKRRLSDGCPDSMRRSALHTSRVHDVGFLLHVVSRRVRSGFRVKDTSCSSPAASEMRRKPRNSFRGRG